MRCPSWFIGFLPGVTLAFNPVPVRWGGLTARRFFLASAPSDLQNTAAGPPPKLMMLDQFGPTSADDIPYFRVNSDETISWDARWCLEAVSDQHGDAVQLSHCKGGQAQLWKLVPYGVRKNMIQLKGTTKCIGIAAETGLNNDPIPLQECTNEATQFWTFEDKVLPPTHGKSVRLFAHVSAVFLLLSIGAWLLWWRLQKKSQVVTAGGVPSMLDRGGISLASPLATNDQNVVRLPNFGMDSQGMASAVMAISSLAAETGSNTRGGSCSGDVHLISDDGEAPCELDPTIDTRRSQRRRNVDMPMSASRTGDVVVPRALGLPPLSRRGHIFMSTTSPPKSCETLLKSLFDGVVDADAVADACSDDVEWDDFAVAAPISGRSNVRDHIRSKFPRDSRLVIDRIADGQRSGGFIWHREVVIKEETKMGLRGTLFAELNAEGQISYVREGCEPILKPGSATEAILKAATKDIERPPKPEPTYTEATPTTASTIAQYLWQDAYPGGAKPDEALRLMSDNIVYEDFNYPKPFEGKAAVKEFVTAFDIPGIEFVPLKISEGERACAFTWKVLINGKEGPQGISFYAVDEQGRIEFIRDIPAPTPRFFRPLGALATKVDPELRILTLEKLASASLGVGSAGMGLLKPLFAIEAKWQAETFGDESSRQTAIAQLERDVASAPCVVYTYGLSPFSSEALSVLEATGASYSKIELGPEWFLLNGVASNVRAELLERHGMSSLPHIFIGGESVGGLFSGNQQGAPGLVELQRQGKLEAMLEEAGAL